MPRYAMVIDLQRCTGCSACSISCRNENNVPDGIYWANKITETSGVFPNVRYHYIPTLCNHCENAPCVRGCPTRAMHKLENGITMHNPKKCIGCKYCEFNCPYGVIYFNWTQPHKPWKNNNKVLDGTTSPKEEVKKVGGKTIPYYNPEREDTLPGIRQKGVVEKCTFCDHRVRRGKLPRCVDACPADARIFGDMNDPDSKVRQLLGKFRPFRLREQIGTEPHVFYIKNFNPANYQPSKGGI
ncbi:MAG: 4Fe-4S dicluster domain-containing protein [Desulfobacula sp.]|nr:4Fe-4S dicluster domain-containing protein [Desulfobacula sp.]